MSQPAQEVAPSYSVTSLMVYEACPRQYWLTYVEGVPPPRSEAMKRGTSLHKLIADHLTRPPLFPPEIPDELAPLFSRFTASRFNTAPIECEQAFTLAFPCGDVRGRVDLVLPGQGEALEIVDFKSGSARRGQDFARSLQLPIYARAVAAQTGHDLSRIRLTYFFLQDGAELSYAAASPIFADVDARVDRIMRAIQAGRFTPRRGCRCFACVPRSLAGRSRA